tara:strand:- start:1723 stop:1905 length:183 start_codon:yes stop_codon:yes gene_type:complete
MTAGKPLLGLLASVATLVVYAKPASAWKYVEHTAIGTKGYKQARKSIEARLRLLLKTPPV